ncbi:BMP family lipoprotein [Turicibacter sanguinis]|uniref:BMP family lipoprotein n=1 Tax=Turicibacter sanguinis TaxID=154288 RepID=UPI0018A9EAB1|nr:BMP family ABC transporter substrate-binding protein [Turicibacter sanguinis]
MKKLLSMFAVAMCATVGLTACGGAEEAKTETPQTGNQTTVKVGMMTDSGTIDDKSFNQGTWAGIQQYAADHTGVEVKYVQPGGEAKEDYLSAADNLIMSGNQIIVAPGFKFEKAINELQVANPDTKFIILDGQPAEMAENTVAIYFAEQEAGFLAGVAAALQTQTGKVGFIGGMKIPAVEKFGFGYVAGVAYANATYGLEVEVADYLYNGTFTDVQGGQAQAGGMYDKGIDIVFVAAGGVGNGVINEAKTRAEAGEEVYVIGVDVDQYEEGVMSNGKSVILTSAIKRIDNAAYENIDAFVNGNFPGGQVITMDAKTNGIGLPEVNPNLTEDTTTKTNEVFEAIKAGTVVAPTSAEELELMLAELGYDASNINFK